MSRQYRFLILLLGVLYVAPVAFAGFSYGDNTGLPVKPGDPWYNVLSAAADALSTINPDASAGLKKMLQGGQINRGFGTDAEATGGATIADGKEGVEGDKMNINDNFVNAGGTVDPTDSSTWTGSCWNQLVGVMAHEWVHANDSRQPPQGPNPDPIADYLWEKPAYEKEMEVLEKLGEPGGWYQPVMPPGFIGPPDPPFKTRREWLKQKLEEKRKKAEEALRKLLEALAWRIAVQSGTAHEFSCGVIGYSGEQTCITWGVDGTVLWGLTATRDGGDRHELPMDATHDFHPIAGLPVGTGHSVGFVAGSLGDTGVVLGLELDGLKVSGEVLHLDMPGSYPQSISYRELDGSLWILDTEQQAVWSVVDTDGDWLPDTLNPMPYATAADWPVLAESQALFARLDHPGIAVAPSGFVPYDVVPIQEPLTFLLDDNGDGIAEAEMPGVLGEFVQFPPSIVNEPLEGEFLCELFGVAGAEVMVGGCLPTGEFTGEILGIVIIGPDNTAEVDLMRPLMAGECVRAFDPVNDPPDEGGVYEVPPFDTNRRPIPVFSGPQIVVQTSADGADVTLDASGSYDREGEPLEFEWQELLDSYSDAPIIGVGPAITVPMSYGIHVVRVLVSDGEHQTRSYTSVGVTPAMDIDVDIRPESDRNPVNPKSKGVIPVAVLTDEDFDAATLDPETVTLDGAPVATRGRNNKLLAEYEDIDGDGDVDLLLKFENDLDLEPGTQEVQLFGFAYDGTSVGGVDTVTVVPARRGGH